MNSKIIKSKMLVLTGR
jgi:hypothetical protein